MQKWQERQRQKIHQSIIQNAKPTIKRTDNLGKSRQKNIMSTSRSKQLRINPAQTNQGFMPFVKILELFQLQKYSNLLIQHGFPHKLADKKSMRFIDDILEHVEENDQERFLSLMNTLTIMSKDLQKNVPVKRNSFMNIKKQKSSKNTVFYPPPPSTSNLRQSSNYPPSSKKAQKNTFFKVRQTNINNFKSPTLDISQPYMSSKFQLSRPSRSTQRIKQTKQLSGEKYTIKNQDRLRKHSKTPKKKQIKISAFDDGYITHSFKNSSKAIPTSISQSNKIIERLIQKLKTIDPKKVNNKISSYDDLHMSLQQIKKMYLSFDSGTLTSNIGNIDMQEIIQCYVEQIYQMISQSYRKRTIKEEQQISQVRRINNRSYTMRHQRPTPPVKRTLIEFENKQEIEYLLKQSFVMDRSESPLNRQVNPQITVNKYPLRLLRSRERVETQEAIDESIMEESSLVQKAYLNKEPAVKQSIENQNQQMQTGNNNKQYKNHISPTKSVSIKSSTQSVQESDDLIGVDYQIESFIEDFSCFDSRLEESLRPLQKSDIKNFVQLVVMAGKMQKQMPIIAYLYVKKLIQTKRPYISKPRLTLYNWKNIVLVTLISASKIWDDTSLENHSFSKVLHPYTTYQINRLQKYFLYYIDYKLTINPKQYCESYFKLRNHQRDAHKTAHLMQLDIKTIQMLQDKQQTSKVKQSKLKQYYKKRMDRSV